MKPHRITVRRANDGRWYWKRQAGNNFVVDDSEQGFRRRRYAVRDAEKSVPSGVDYYIVILP